ncbi:MAG: hypothetical protein ACPLW8_04815 [Candidatus Bathyarchaeales archaeon]
MPEAIPVLKVENPHFTIQLYDNLLRIDLKGSLKSEMEEALENKPVLKETLGGLLSIFVPLHIRLSDIDSVQMDETGKVTVTLPYHRHIAISLERKHAEEFVDKLNQLIQKAKDREIKEHIMRKRAEKEIKRKPHQVPPSSYVTFPYYFPTEQVDIVDKLRRKKKKGKK